MDNVDAPTCARLGQHHHTSARSLRRGHWPYLQCDKHELGFNQIHMNRHDGSSQLVSTE